MEFLYAGLLFLILVAALYCIRLLRNLSSRVNKRSEKMTSEINKLGNRLEKSAMTSFRQTQALIQLFNLLDIKAPMPPTRSWAASPDLLLMIMQTIKREKPSLVVELGSGVSTLIASKSGARKIVSLDNSEIFAAKTREMLREHKVRGVDIRVATLKPYANGSEWYDTEVIQNLRKIDLLIIDGPPGSKNPEARYPALREFKDKLSAKATIIIDDVNREGERKLAEDFAKELPNHQLVILDHEKGTAVISPR